MDIASLADTTVVLLAPGMGDGIQAAKAGILEIADIFVVNKADRDGADQVVRDLRYMQSLGGRHRSRVRGGHPSSRPWRRGERASASFAPRSRSTASGWFGTANLTGAESRGRLPKSRRSPSLDVRDRITAVHGSAALSASAARVVAGETDPYTAASDLVAALAN